MRSRLLLPYALYRGAPRAKSRACSGWGRKLASGLFQVDVVQCDPPSVKSADCDYFGTGNDGQGYAIKTVNGRNGKAPAAEMFCHELAAACGIAVPPYEILRMPDETEAFGSRWEGGVSQETALVTQILSGTLPAIRLAERLSAIFGFDYFVGNGDRHANNYLFRRSLKDEYVVLAYDFSRAWTWHKQWPLPLASFAATSRTMECRRALNPYQPFKEPDAQEVLKALRNVPVSFVQGVLNKMPVSWLDKAQRKAIVKWWSSKERTARIDFLKKGISDGTLL